MVGTVESAVHRDERRVGAVVRSYDKPRVLSCVSTVIYSFHRGEACDDVSVNKRPSSDDQSEELALNERSPLLGYSPYCCRHRRCPPGPQVPRLPPSFPPLPRRLSNVAPCPQPAACLRQRLNPPFQCSTRSHLIVVVGQY